MRGFRRRFIFQDTSNGGVVKSAKASNVGSSSHEKCSIWEDGFGFEKHIRGLSWGYEKCVGLKGLDINSIGFHHFEGVVCNAEEELIIQRSVD